MGFKLTFKCSYFPGEEIAIRGTTGLGTLVDINVNTQAHTI
jgi:hypothetical protein